MLPRNHVEAARAQARSKRKDKGSNYRTLLALAGAKNVEASKTLLRRLRGGILGGDLSLSGSEDMCQAIRDGMLALEVSIRVFESVSPQTRATEESK